MKKGVAIGGLILVTVIWGGGFVASDMALESMKPFQIMMVRFLLASVLMGLVSMGQRKKEAKIENRAGAIKAGMLMGLTLFAGFALQIVGLQYTTPSKNAFLTALNVVIVPFIAFVILKKKVGVKGILPMVDKDDHETLQNALKIEDGKDQVTLFTCTPYGVNSHRLLVRGTRVPYNGEEEVTGSVADTMLHAIQNYYMLYLLLGIAITVLIIVIMKVASGRKQRNT